MTPARSLQCIRCGGASLCSFCLFHRIDQWQFLPPEAKWEPMKGMRVNGKPIEETQRHEGTVDDKC